MISATDWKLVSFMYFVCFKIKVNKKTHTHSYFVPSNPNEMFALCETQRNTMCSFGITLLFFLSSTQTSLISILEEREQMNDVKSCERMIKRADAVIASNILFERRK